MALRGERVGTAYVRILADGSGLNKSIRDEIKEANAGDEFYAAGRTDSLAYQEGYNEQVDKFDDRFMDGLVAAVRRNTGRHNAAIEQLHDGSFDNLERQIRYRWPLIGEQMVANMREGFQRSGGDTDLLDDFVENFSAEAERATKQFEAKWQAGLDRLAAISKKADADRYAEALEMNKTFDRNRLTLLRNTLADAYQQNRIFNEKVTADSKAARDAEKEHLAGLRDEWNILARAVADYHKGIDKTHRSRRDLLRSIKELRTEFSLAGDSSSDLIDKFKRLRLAVIDTTPSFFKFEQSIRRYADATGRAFGKGSRNNFLNFIGSLVRNIVGIVPAFFAATNAVRRFGVSIFEAGRDRGPMAALGVAAGGLIKLLGGLGAAAGIAAGGLFLLAPLAAMLSQLTGIVVALASSIGYALVGALGAIPAVVLPAAAGIAALAIAFFDLDKAEKAALKNDVKPVIDAFKDLADAARQRIFDDLADQAERFADVIGGLHPLFRRLGGAISTVVTGWIEGMESPAFDRFVDAMTDFLPGAVRRLGRITAETFGAFGGIFVAMIPFMEQVLDYLVDITDEFNEWANSAAGRNEIGAFFADAKESLTDFWDFLTSVGDLLGELMAAGKHSGDEIFGNMADAIDGWVNAIERNPDILDDWFDSARDFAEVLGEVFLGFGKLFDALDNEFSRSLTVSFFEIVASALEGLVTLMESAAGIFGSSGDALLQFAGAAAAAALILPRLTTAIAGVKLAMSGIVGPAATGVSRMNALATAARGAAGIGGLLSLTAASQTSNEGLGVLFNTLGGAATGFALGGPIGALIGGGLGGLLGIANAAGKADGGVESMVATFEDLAPTLDTVTGSITENTRAYILNQLAQAGVLTALEAEGVSRRTVINAIAGEKGARKELNAELRESEGVIKDEEAAIRDLANERDNLNASGATSVDNRNYDKAAKDRVDAIDLEIAALERSIKRRKDNIQSVRDATGATRDAVREARQNIAATRDFGNALKDLPTRIRTKINAEGIVPTTRGIAKVAEKYKLLDKKEISTLIEATGTDFTVRQIQRVLDKLKETDKQEPTPKLKADDTVARNKVRDASRLLADYGKSIWESTITADYSQVEHAVTDTERLLNMIEDESVTVHVERTWGGGAGPPSAQGGVFAHAQMRLIGEAGAEAVVPLNRRLSDVDPAVRYLSAIAQGLASPSMTPQGKTIDVGGLTVVSNAQDPHAVAAEVINTLVATTY